MNDFRKIGHWILSAELFQCPQRFVARVEPLIRDRGSGGEVCGTIADVVHDDWFVFHGLASFPVRYDSRTHLVCYGTRPSWPRLFLHAEHDALGEIPNRIEIALKDLHDVDQIIPTRFPIIRKERHLH